MTRGWRRCCKALDKAEQETGHKTLYMVSITDEVDRVHDKARRAVRAGATGLLLAYSGRPVDRSR